MTYYASFCVFCVLWRQMRHMTSSTSFDVKNVVFKNLTCGLVQKSRRFYRENFARLICRQMRHMSSNASYDVKCCIWRIMRLMTYYASFDVIWVFWRQMRHMPSLTTYESCVIKNQNSSFFLFCHFPVSYICVDRPDCFLKLKIFTTPLTGIVVFRPKAKTFCRVTFALHYITIFRLK